MSAASDISKTSVPKHLAAVALAALLLMSAEAFTVPAWGQTSPWVYDVTLTGYPEARWKSLTSYIDKPALGDVTGDGVPEILAASVFGDVFCVDGITGQILWAYEDEHSFELAIYICPAIVDVDCDTLLDVISVTPQGYVICLDGRTGRKRWGFQAEGAIIFSPSAFDLDRNGTPEICVSDMKGNLYLLSNDGRQIWKTSSAAAFYGTAAMGLIEGQPAVLMSDRSGALRCFDGMSGDLIWRFEPSSVPISTSPIVFKDPHDPAMPWKVLVGTEEGTVYLANALNGEQRWSRSVSGKNEVVGDFAVGDVDGNGSLDLIFSTADSRVVAARVADGKEMWNRKFDIPVKEFLAIRDPRRRVSRDVLTGEPLLADLDGDGRVDVIVDIRGLNNFIFGLRGSDGKTMWKYGTTDLLKNPALNESTTLACCMDVPFGAYSFSVPAFSQPTPILADFDGDGRADLIINDRDEVGLISVPIPAAVAEGTWAKYVANPCNNNVNFYLPCLGLAPPPTIKLDVSPQEIFRGESARLCWNSNAMGEIEIDQGIGLVKTGDCINVAPTENTTWNAIARSCGGEARDLISLLVKAPPPPPPPPPPIAEVWSLEDVFFEYDWYRLTPQAIATLDENVRKLKAHPYARVALEATCDERGSTIYNEFLAIARVEAVREYMVEHGIEPARMELRPTGESTKWDPRLSDQGWALNRRVHFVILP